MTFPVSVHRYSLALLSLMLISGTDVFAFTAIRNYASAVKIRDVLQSSGGITYAASSGGLSTYDENTNLSAIVSTPDECPDLDLTALAEDSSGNIWYGSASGYLVARDRYGAASVYTAYAAAVPAWHINALAVAGDYLLIGADQGCSVFDVRRRVVVGGIAYFGSFKSCAVNVMTIKNDTLLLGLDEGTAAIAVGGTQLKDGAVSNPGSWTTHKTALPVRAFAAVDTGLVISPVFAAGIAGGLLRALGDSLLIDTVLVGRTPGRITALRAAADGRIWVGTETHGLAKWPEIGVDPLSRSPWTSERMLPTYLPNSLTFSYTLKVYVDASGRLWATPYVTWPLSPWFQGVARFDDSGWHLYNETAPRFGSMGQGTNFKGICQDNEGQLWFGNEGGSLKRYSPDADSWWGYDMASEDKLYFERSANGNSRSWSACNVIARDSSGYMWFGTWSKELTQKAKGALLCWNPASGDPDSTIPNFAFRFPAGSAGYVLVPTMLHVSSGGRIYYADEFNALFSFIHLGNPVTGVGVIRSYPTDKGRISSMAAASDGSSWAATEKAGLCVTNDRMSSLISAKYTPEELLSSVVVVETSSEVFGLEGSADAGNATLVRSTVYAGTAGRGLARMKTATYVSAAGLIDSARVDTLTYITKTEGLVGNDVTSLAYDPKAGILWAATKTGISALDLGRRADVAVDNASVRVYPLPYVASRHAEIVFDRITPGSTVYIHDAAGRMVAILDESNSDVRHTALMWTLAWHPSRTLLPGTYFYSVRKDGKLLQHSHSGKLLVLP